MPKTCVATVAGGVLRGARYKVAFLPLNTAGYARAPRHCLYDFVPFGHSVLCAHGSTFQRGGHGMRCSWEYARNRCGQAVVDHFADNGLSQTCV